MSRPAVAASTRNYGFVIDNRKCIGCHACSTACKSENQVPLGVNRTWVKYVETGRFPNSRRHFQVTRCNHCANPPCVRICPTEAMYQRADGIVEFDNRYCIGCKACLQACPYDAIYIDPDTNTAAKCHYCAHRTDIGLEPACVVVCPEQAIISGDMNDPTSEISRLLSREQVTVRKPEQGTAPKLFYIDGADVSLHPTAAGMPASFLWADVVTEQGIGYDAARRNGASPQHSNQSALRPGQPQGAPWAGPIQIGDGRVAEQMVQVSYNAQHKIPWHWPVPAYLTTKAVGSGMFMLLGLGLLLDWFAFDALTVVAGGLLSLVFIGLTTGFLVLDLEKPGRFHYILLRPQWRSWLARGAVILIGFSVVAGLWWLLETAAWGGWLGAPGDWLRLSLLALGLPLALLVAIYTAFLFAQAEGRDLWQSPLLPFHLAVQAGLAGSATFLLLVPLLALPAEMSEVCRTALVVTLLVSLFLTLVGEFGMPHATDTAAAAAHEMSRGRYRRHFWWGAIALGHLLPLVLLTGGALAGALAGACALAGLFLYEYAYVMAPQHVPNS